MKEKVKETLKQLGFDVDEVEDFIFHFQYEGLSYLCAGNMEDDEFLSIAIPDVIGRADVSELDYYKLMDSVNSALKYVKAYTFDNDMWLACERKVYEGDDMMLVIGNMIQQLDCAFVYFASEMRKMIADNDSTSDEEE